MAVTFLNFSFLIFGSFSINDYSEIISNFGAKTYDGATAIDISSYILPMKIFTYLFRPLFFEARDLFTILMAVENSILLSVIVYPFLISIKNSSKFKITQNKIKFSKP